MIDRNVYGYNKVSTFVYNILVKLWRLQNLSFTKRIWNFLWKISLRRYVDTTILTTIHGHDVVANYGYTYPLIVRRYPTYDAPIIELVYSIFNVKREKISVVDVGSAIGDTMLSLFTNCPNMIGDFVCVDGDDEFYKYLVHNLQSFPNGKFLFAFLSSSPGEAKSLVKIHPGTASAQGESIIPCTTLDLLLQENKIKSVDLLKIDVDGFDGKILAGAVKTLEKHKPAVIFEWHPLICSQVQNSWIEHFDVLHNNGYDKFLWFDNYGKFSHFMTTNDLASISFLAEMLIENRMPHVAYFDIIALHRDSKISPSAVAALKNAKYRLSWQ